MKRGRAGRQGRGARAAGGGASADADEAAGEVAIVRLEMTDEGVACVHGVIELTGELCDLLDRQDFGTHRRL